MIRSYSIKVLILMTFVLITSSYSNVSSSYERCVKVENICQSYKRHSYIFSCTLTKVEESQNFFQYTFSSDTVYKGKPSNKFVCKSLKDSISTMCIYGPELKQGLKYLVFVRTIGTENLLISDLFFNTKILSESSQELKTLTENKRRPFLSTKFCESGK